MNVLKAMCFKHVGTGDVCWQIVEYGVFFCFFQNLNFFPLFCIFTDNKFAGVSFLFQFLILLLPLYLLQPTAFIYQRDFSIFVIYLKLNWLTQNQQKTAFSSSCRDLLYHLLMYWGVGVKHHHHHIFPPSGGHTVPDHDLSVAFWYLPAGSQQSVLESHGQRSIAVEVLPAQGYATLAFHWSSVHATTGRTTHQWRWDRGR